MPVIHSIGYIRTRSENDPNINSYGKKNLGGTPFLFSFLREVIIPSTASCYGPSRKMTTINVVAVDLPSRLADRLCAQRALMIRCILSAYTWRTFPQEKQWKRKKLIRQIILVIFWPDFGILDMSGRQNIQFCMGDPIFRSKISKS